MVRIKFTGPPGPNAAMQMQAAPGLKTLASKPPAAVQNKSQNEVGEPAHPAAQQTMLSKQQQSLEMVQIMLHVSVSLPFVRNTFMMAANSMLQFGTLFYLRCVVFLPISLAGSDFSL